MSPCMSDNTSSRLIIIDHVQTTCIDKSHPSRHIEGWSPDDILQIGCEDEPTGQLQHNAGPVMAANIQACIQFNPGVICFYPLASMASFRLVSLLLETMPAVPLVVYVTEDWLEPLRVENQERFVWFDAALREILAKSARRLCLGADMGRAYASRYGGYWISCVHLERHYVSFPQIPAGQLLLGPLARTQSAHIDETMVIAHLYAGMHSTNNTIPG